MGNKQRNSLQLFNIIYTFNNTIIILKILFKFIQLLISMYIYRFLLRNLSWKIFNETHIEIYNYIILKKYKKYYDL